MVYRMFFLGRNCVMVLFVHWNLKKPLKTFKTKNFSNKNTFYGMRYLSHCCSLYCCRDIKPQIYPGCKLDLDGYMTSSVTWPHDSLYLISYRCFIDTDTNSKSGALTILELLALNAQKFKGSRDPDHEPFQFFSGVVSGLGTLPVILCAKFEVHISYATSY